MLNNLKEISYEENIKMVLNGTSYANSCAYNESILYKKHKEGKDDEIEEYYKIDMTILELLENLGYPMDELGTYLYKDIIKEATTYIKKIKSKDDVIKYDWLKYSLNDAYSNFYHWIARDDKEMGINLFHLYIARAVLKINYEAINKDIAKKIYRADETETTYGLQVLNFVEYLNGNHMVKNNKVYKQMRIGTLPNMKKDIELR